MSVEDVQITKRHFLKILGLIGLATFASPVFSNSNIFIPNLGPITAKQVGITIFRELSKIVTFNQELNPDSVVKMYNVFKKEPWVNNHITKAYNKLLKYHQDTTINLDANYFDSTEIWFIRHLLVTWYSGVYYYEGQEPQKVLHEQALVWETLKHTHPIPYYSNITKWEEKPNI